MDQLRVLTGMDSMTDPAAFAAVLPVDMKVMQVIIPVAESCCEACRGEPEQVAVMAAETKLERVVGIRYIEIRRVGLDQELDIR